MPTRTITLNPGVNTEYTPSLNEAAFQNTNLIRFSPSGLPEKLGGWTKFYPLPIGSIVNSLHAWEDTSGVEHLGLGSDDSLNVITNGTLNNITPDMSVTNPAVVFTTTENTPNVLFVDIGAPVGKYNAVVIDTQISVGGLVLLGAYSIINYSGFPEHYVNINPGANFTSTVVNGGSVPSFTSVSGSASVAVVLDNHGLSVGSTFPIVVPTNVGGLILDGFYTVSSVIDTNNFTITASNQASSSATVSMNGGNARFTYYASGGQFPLEFGYGGGGYGTGGYGNGVEGLNSNTYPGSPISAIDYTIDNWGADMIACPANGPIFVWNPYGGLPNAQMIPQAPIANTGIFVSMPSQIMIAYGSSVLSIQDPLLINWCNPGDYTVWTAAVTNLAGSYRIPRGSRIVGGIQGPQYALIWTDLDVWSMTYIGSPYVFSFSELATGCGMISKFACGTLLTTVYWMSQEQFFILPAGGSVSPLPCQVWDFIFQNLDITNLESIRCGVNSQFGEVSWHFPVIGGNGQNAAYVKYTPQFSCWDVGFLGRSAWIDQSVFGAPIGADPASQYIYQHETSTDADGQPMGESFTTGYWALSDGQDQIFCDLVMPDMKFGKAGGSQNAQINLSFSYTDYAVNAPVYGTPTYTMQPSGSSFFNVRFRGRLASMTVGNSTVGSWWRLGGLRVRMATDGRL